MAELASLTTEQLRQIVREEVQRGIAGALTDRVLLACLRAPLDDEPYTEEQQREDDQAQAGFERGECSSLETMKLKFGL